MKKTYISPAINVVQVEAASMLASSLQWTPNNDKNNGFNVTEEDANDFYGDEDF